MDQPSFGAGIRRFQQEHTNRYAAYALTFYTAVIYIWSLWSHPLGIDYRYMSAPHDTMPAAVASLFRAEMTVFGSWAPPYHIINVALLYLCALLVYFIGRQLIKDPAWLSLLAAVLYMASPVHRDAVFSLSGVRDLFPAVLALAAIYTYLEARQSHQAKWRVLAPLLFAAATLIAPQNLFLITSLVLAEVLLPAEKRPWISLGTCSLAFLLGVWRHWEALGTDPFNPGRMWAPVYFALQPAGFLPGTTRQFAEVPWLAWGSAGLVLAFVVLIVWKTKSKVFVWALLSALMLRLGQGSEFFDFVHLLGGGRLLVSSALVLIAVSEVFFCMIRHPKWHRPVVTGTTIWCLILFGMQIHGAFVWRDAANLVKRFQKAVAANVDEAQVGILPDVIFYRGVPAAFAEATRYTTAFSTAHDAQPLLRLNVSSAGSVSFEIESYGPQEALVKVHADVIPYLWYPLTRPIPTETTTAEVEETGDGWVQLRISPHGQTLPPSTLPALDALQPREPLR